MQFSLKVNYCSQKIPEHQGVEKGMPPAANKDNIMLHDKIVERSQSLIPNLTNNPNLGSSQKNLGCDTSRNIGDNEEMFKSPENLH